MMRSFGAPLTPPDVPVSPAGVLRNPSGQVAQLVEQGIENPRVGGSIPSLGTIIKSPAFAGLFLSGLSYVN